MTKRNAKKDVYEIVTDLIIESLEEGVMPWECPWAREALWPTNGDSKRPYSGINVLLLWLAAARAAYTSPYWLTFKQAQKAGGSVRKGEKSTLVTFFKIKRVEEDNEAGKVEEKTIPILRYYRVFNAEQCDDVEFPTPGELDEAHRIERADAFFEAIGATLGHGGHRACYSALRDDIQIPPFASFDEPASYYATLAHEFIHWSGHDSRLNRDLAGRFGDASYAMEELIAELGAAFVCARLGFAYRTQHASYVDHWLSVLGEDRYAIFTAARAAGEAADFLLEQAGFEDEADEDAA